MSTGTRIGDIYDLKVDSNGKVRIQKNEAKKRKKLPLNKQIAARKNPPQKWQKAGKIT